MKIFISMILAFVVAFTNSAKISASIEVNFEEESLHPNSLSNMMNNGYQNQEDLVSKQTAEEVIDEEWEAFKLKHQKSYDDSTEDDFRMKIFMENKHRIAQHNILYHQNKTSYTMKINEYGDLLPHEFSAMMNGYREDLKGNQTADAPIFIPPANVELPESVDWRDAGAVVPVKNQGRCGSCWAFSTTGAVEGQQFRKTGKLVSLSEQNLLDCSYGKGEYGCNGGDEDYAFEFIKKMGGIDTEESYPYEARDPPHGSYCRYNKKNVGARVLGYKRVQSGDEHALEAAVATVGPIAVAVDASPLQHYHSGVIDDCPTQPKLNHAVLAVGYEITKDGQPVWIVKNSWGKDWGVGGYFFLHKNAHNQCGVATDAAFPLV